MVAISTAAALVAFTALPALSHAAVGDINTVAGTGTAGFSGDGGPATSAELSAPDRGGGRRLRQPLHRRLRQQPGAQGGHLGDDHHGRRHRHARASPATGARPPRPSSTSLGVAVDGSGNLYIADYDNDRVRKVDASGTITTVAGTGTAGFSGDGGPATSAQLNAPYGVAVDGSGNLYIADCWQPRVRKVDASGTITTVAGQRAPPGFSGDGGPATSAELDALRGGGRRRRQPLHRRHRQQPGPQGRRPGTITTVAGTGTAGFTGDGGPATSAQLNDPRRRGGRRPGNLYIADTATAGCAR